jgi:ribosomal protein L37AE/L43A
MSTYERLEDDDRCAVCGRDKELIEQDGVEKCRHCATEANVRRAHQ